ncbi:MAG: MmcB family DNA repair protein [Proteobacteria bacterium]|nr:MmcB family DNA repair protein [Pseudomonadota bacterium]
MELQPDGRQSETALRIARGVRRHLVRLGFASLPEVPLRSGRRADLLAVNGRGDIWIIEIKSSVADFRADSKWPDYLSHCDRFYFATTLEVPTEIFPDAAGLIIADAFGAETIREAPPQPLAGATRKEVLIRFGLSGAARLHALADPEWTGHGP